MGCQQSQYNGVGNTVKRHDSLFLSGVRVFEADEIEIGQYISEGSSGKVYEGIDKSNNKKYALKFFGYTQRVNLMANIEAEIDLIQNLQGIDGLVQLIGVLIDSEEGLLGNRVSARPFPIIIMELLDGGELYEHLEETDAFSEQNIAKIFKGVVITLDGNNDVK